MIDCDYARERFTAVASAKAVYDYLCTARRDAEYVSSVGVPGRCVASPDVWAALNSP
jgi:hypothetical protein